MSIPPKRFFEAFGEIGYHYASLEFGIKATLGGMLNIHTFDALIITEPHTSFALRNVAKSIAKACLVITDADKEKFVHIIGEFGKFGPLRNTVAHCRWRKGDRRHSLRPIGLDIRSGTAKLLGYDPSEKDWTSAELRAEAVSLIKLNAKLVMFQRSSGLAASIAKNDEDTMRAIESRIGSSTIAS